MILAPSFADIFVANCRQNGIAALVVEEMQLAEISRRAENNAPYQLTIDLPQRELRDDAGLSVPFAIDNSYQQALIHGLDATGDTLLHEAEIAAFEARRQAD